MKMKKLANDIQERERERKIKTRRYVNDITEINRTYKRIPRVVLVYDMLDVFEALHPV
jgi:hypothetical protein